MNLARDVEARLRRRRQASLEPNEAEINELERRRRNYRHEFHDELEPLTPEKTYDLQKLVDVQLIVYRANLPTIILS
ncbi:unnamed protein product [Protopolystoma xenopodis]|uniref:Uncharacterized protein n=1 Tax=Protopolystoma xenopodis TaxID=117903 RepID=A0A3S5B970_9PLAT|nr:unnamed protein product [Protopolystoma xenopodis]